MAVETSRQSTTGRARRRSERAVHDGERSSKGPRSSSKARRRSSPLYLHLSPSAGARVGLETRVASQIAIMGERP